MTDVASLDRDRHFSADASELFFDLVFIFAFSRLVAHLVDNPDWGGYQKFALLFTMIWFAWTTFTWSANAAAGTWKPVRALFLVATIASVPMASAVTTAFEDGGPAFAISTSVIMSMGVFTMIAGMRDNRAVRDAALRFSGPVLLSVCLMLARSRLHGGARSLV